MLTVDGLQVPATPLFELAGSVGTRPPEQIVSELPKLKTGTVFVVTFTVKEVVVAHNPAEGVNV